MIDTVLESLLYRTERISTLLYRNSIVLVECGWMPLPDFSNNLEMGLYSISLLILVHPDESLIHISFLILVIVHYTRINKLRILAYDILVPATIHIPFYQGQNHTRSMYYVTHYSFSCHELRRERKKGLSGETVPI
jgi:hypothetical protein